MIMLELLGGTRTPREYQELEEELQALRFANENEKVWRSAWQLSFELRRKGLTIPSTDILIASVALQYGYHLLHADRHFELISKNTNLQTQMVRLK
jgi:predicted nucleic acid-binding protein